MRWLSRWPLALALAAAAALAFAVALAWPARPCRGWLFSAGPRDVLPILLALCFPLGLGVVAGPRWPRWLGGAVLLLAGAFAGALAALAFLVATAATTALALVAGARRARSAALLALAAAALAGVTLRYAARASGGCRAMSAAVAALPLLDVRCGTTGSSALPDAPGAPTVPPEIQVRCRDGRAVLVAVPVLPALPTSSLSWVYDRERDRWELMD